MQQIKNKMFNIIKFFLIVSICNASVNITLYDDKDNIYVNIARTPCQSSVMKNLITTNKVGDLTTANIIIDDSLTTNMVIDDFTTIDKIIEDLTITTKAIEDLPTTTKAIEDLPTTTKEIEDLPTTNKEIEDLPTTNKVVEDLPTTTKTSNNLEKAKYLVYGDSGILHIEYSNFGMWDKTQFIDVGKERNIKDMVLFKEKLMSNLDNGSYVEINKNNIAKIISTNVLFTTKTMKVCGDRILQITTDNRIIYSNDGINYNEVTSDLNGIFNKIAYNPINNIIIISGTTNVYRSNNGGSVFTKLTSTQNTNTIKYLNGKFYALENNMTSIIGREYNRIVTSSDDGITWDYLYSNRFTTSSPLIDIEYSSTHDRLIILKDGPTGSTIYYALLDFASYSQYHLIVHLDGVYVIKEEPNNLIVYTDSEINNYAVNPGSSKVNYMIWLNTRNPPLGYNGAISMNF